MLGRKRSGFTLVEMMIVMGIVAVLAAMTLPIYAKSRYRGQLVACTVNERNLATALESYSSQEGRYPDETVGLPALTVGSTTHIQKLPTCPSTNGDYSYTVDAEGKSYTVFCGTGVHHLVTAEVGQGFPQYTNHSGSTLK